MDSIVGVVATFAAVYALALSVMLLLNRFLVRVNFASRKLAIRPAALIAAIPTVVLLAAFLLQQDMGFKHIPQRQDPVGAKLETSPTGNAILSAPKVVEQYKEFDVSLRLERKTLDQLIELTKWQVNDANVKGVTGVSMSPRMSAQLTGADFVIDPKDPQEQAIAMNQPTLWKWRVNSSMIGERVLKARLSTLLQIDGQETPRTIDVGEARIEVEANWLEAALRHWKLILTVIVVPAIGGLIHQAFTKHTNAPKDP